jgi:hypothetical protein
MKWAAIWLSVLTILYLVNLVGDLWQARRLRALEKRVRELSKGD